MIFRLKRKKQRKHSWIVLRAINRMNGHDTKENNIDIRFNSNIQEESFIVENESIIITFSNKGAIISDIKLKNYTNPENEKVNIYGESGNFDIIINPDKGDLEIWRNRIVVEDGKVEDPNAEIELKDAVKIEPDFEVGEEVSEEFKIVDLGRRAIQSLRQNLVSKVFEHDSLSLIHI